MFETPVKERVRNMQNFIARFVREDEGQDLVEYALLIAFIALACIVGLTNLGTAINNTYNSISTSLSGAVS
jgi:pilus assembly protein Flp/PilA